MRIATALALLVAAVMAVLCLALWGPIPVGALWIAAQISDGDHHLFGAILAAFALCVALLVVGLLVLRRLDALWVALRRTAGHDQRDGILGPMFAVCAVVGGAGFTIWLVFVAGLGSSLVPGHS